MYQTIYIIILSYFALGGFGFYLINRKKDPKSALESWVKFVSYFVIINVVFFSIVINSFAFRLLAVIIVSSGFFELLRLFLKAGFSKKLFFSVFLLVFSFFCVGFLMFSGFDKDLILFTFLVLSIFDAFSQISGQLFGRHKIFPKISPNKTVEGLVGGAIIALISTFLIEKLIPAAALKAMAMAAGVVVFALVGDVTTSWYKRQYKVKDFSHLIPGHGGFLDRFDSLIAGGAWIAWLELILQYAN